MRKKIVSQCQPAFWILSRRKETVSLEPSSMEGRAKSDLLQPQYYKLNEMLLKITGQWPNQSTRDRCGFLAVVLLICISQLIPQAIAIAKHLRDGDFVIEFVTPLTFAGFYLTKLSFSIFNSKKMLTLLRHMNTDWHDWALDRDVDILHEYAERGRNLTIFYVVVGYSTCALFAAQPIVPKIIDILLRNGTEPGEMPVPLDYLFIDDLQKYYFYIVFHFFVAISTAFSVIIAHDTLFLVYVHHVCGLYAALGHKLERFGKNNTFAKTYEIACSMDNPNMDIKDLGSCISTHNKVIEYAALIEATYSWCFFFIVGFNMFLITITGIQIVGTTVEPQETLRFVAVNVVAMLHLYIECHMAQILLDHSIIIHDYILNSEWYKLPLKAQKFLLLIMMRCNVPCKITAGNISVMSMEQFSVILKTSMSYFTLLRSI